MLSKPCAAYPDQWATLQMPCVQAKQVMAQEANATKQRIHEHTAEQLKAAKVSDWALHV